MNIYIIGNYVIPYNINIATYNEINYSNNLIGLTQIHYDNNNNNNDNNHYLINLTDINNNHFRIGYYNMNSPMDLNYNLSNINSNNEDFSCSINNYEEISNFKIR